MDENEVENIGGRNTDEVDPERQKIIEALHNKGKLPSLRTYQGDVASFIQTKDQSVAEIALKNKEIKEEKEEKGEINRNFFVPEEVIKPVASSKAPTNALIYILGGILLFASLSVVSYLSYVKIKSKPVEVSELPKQLVDNNKTIPLDLSTMSRDSFGKVISGAKENPEYKGGIVSLDVNGTILDFVGKAGWVLPDALKRNLGDDFVIGLKDSGSGPDFFMIFKVKDYGIAFRDMLSWESRMVADVAPVLSAEVPSLSDYSWKDLIVKNKDSRAFASKNGKVALIYAFLDQSTVLITESEASLSSLTNSFLVGNVVR